MEIVNISLQAEIDGRNEVFEALKEFGEKLIADDHFAKESIKVNLETLNEVKSKVCYNKTMEQSKFFFSICECLDIAHLHLKIR